MAGTPRAFAGPRGAIGLALLAVAFWGTVAWFAELRSDVARSGVGGFDRAPRMLEDDVWEPWPPARAPFHQFGPGSFDARPRPIGLAYGQPSMWLAGRPCPRQLPSLMPR